MPKWIDECVGQVFATLSAAEPDRYVRDDHETQELLAAMAALAARVVDHLEKKGERVATADRPLLVAATLNRAARAEVYTDKKPAVKRFADLRALRCTHQELDLGLLVRADDLTDAEISRLKAAADVVESLDRRSEVNWLWLTMVASAVADPAVDAETTAGTVVDLVDRAHAEAVRFMASRPDMTVTRRAFKELGNPVFFVDTAAMRAAIDRLRGGSTEPVDHTELARLLDELVELSRAYVNDHRQVWWDGGQDAVRVFFAHARFLGGDSDGRHVERIFRTLHPTINGLVLSKGPRPEPRTIAVAAATLTRAGQHYQEGVIGDPGLVEHMVAWAMAELYAGVDTDFHRKQLRQWIVDRTESEKLTADMLMFRLDRLRRLVDRFHRLPDALPDVAGAVTDEVADVRETLTKLITEVVDNRQDVRAAPGAVLPPLWRNRVASVNAVSRKLYASTGRLAPNVAARARVAAGLAVRAPLQFCVRTEVAGRTGPCDCGARTRGGAARATVGPTSVCPHRTWEDPGLVENYATLGQLAEMNPDAVRAALVDYTGPGADWVRTAFDW